MIRFQFVDDHRNTHEVKRMCQVLSINRSSYYKWRAGQAARAGRAAADAVLIAKIEAIENEWDQTLGYRRMTIELRADSDVEEAINKKRVARVMREAGIVGIHLRRGKRTTVKDPGAQVFGDLLGRDFTAEAPNCRYVGDITYLPYGSHGRFLYLATVIDLNSRRLVGWSIADHMRTSLVEDALIAACRVRGTLQGALFHSDHGRQYTSSAFQALCQSLGVAQSMGRVGSSESLRG